MPTSNRTVLGIDPGLERVGYGVIAAARHKLTLLDFGLITTKRTHTAGERLLHIYRELTRIITTFHPEHLALEKLYFSKNVSTALSVGEARGIVLLVAAEQGLTVSEFAPSTIKQSVTGYGAADKRQIQRMIQILYHLPKPPAPDDVADAIAIATCATSPTLP